MSLINDMLKDLDDRKAPQRPKHAGGAQAHISASTLAAPKQRPWLVWVVLGIILLAALWFAKDLYQSFNADLQTERDETRAQAEALLNPHGVKGPEESTSETINANAAADASVAQSPTTQAAKAVASLQVEYIETTPLSQGVRVSLGLSAPVEHRLVEPKGQAIEMQVINTRLAVPLPDLAEESLIQTVSVSHKGDDLWVRINTQEKVVTQSYVLTRQSGPQLVLELIPAEPINNTSKEVATASEPEDTSAAVSKTAPASAEQAATQETVSKAESRQPLQKSTATLSLEARDRQLANQALILARQGEAPLAIRELEEFINKFPGAPQAQKSLASIYLSTRQLEAAKTVLSQAREQRPKDVALIKLEARLFMAQQEPEQALALLDANKSLADRDIEYGGLLAALYQRFEQHENALKLYQNLSVAQPNEIRWQVGQGISMEALGYKNEALLLYQRARRYPGLDASLRNYIETRIQGLN